MLALTRRINLPDVQHADVYADHQNNSTYYIVPTLPALEVDDRDRPTLRLLVYMKKDDVQRSSPSGGQVTLATVLEVSAGELARITQALQRRVSEKGTAGGSDSRAGKVHIVNPDWASGTVTVRLTPTLTLSGQPALFAGNRCALTSALSADQARQLHDDGRRTLATSTIRYDMEIRVASEAIDAAAASSQVKHVEGDVSYEIDRAISVDARMTIW